MENQLQNLNTENPSSLVIQPIAFRFGTIGGLTSILVSLILYLSNLQHESWTKWISSAVMVAAIIVGLKMIADNNKGKIISFGALFGGGMIITVIIACISILYFLVYTNVIEPDFMDKTLDMSRDEMAQKGLSPEQIDNAIAMSKKFMTPGIMVAFSMIGMLFMGGITTLIGALIFKKDK